MNEKKISDPLFVIGYKRSGTTMFRLILNSHPDLAIPPESEYFQRIPSRFGNQRHERSELKDIVDALSEMKRCDFQLNLSTAQISEIVAPVLPAATSELIAALYKYWGTRQGKAAARWGDKKPQNWKYVYRLKEWYPESQYLHIIRDPRDVFASVEEHFPEQIIGRKFLPPHIITAWQWRMMNQEMTKQGKALGPERYWPIQYEVMVKNPEECCRRCCDFLGIEYTPDMLAFQKTAKNPEVQGAKPDRGAHQHTTKQVHSGQIGRFKRSSLPEKVIGDIESICNDMFDLYDWPRSGIRLKPGRTAFLRSVCSALDLTWKSHRARKRLGGGL
jgi:hypothetical protein